MSALQFPPTPSDGDTYAGYVFNAAKNVWQWVTTSIDAVNPQYGDILAYDPTGTRFTNAIDVNGVMVFDDSTARGSAIPSPIEGMVTYLKSDDQVTVFDGSAFKPVGGLVAVKSAIRTAPVSSGSIAAGGNFAVPDLSITHEVQDPANRLIITAFFGAAGSSEQRGNVGIAVNDGTSLIGVAESTGSRTATTAGGDPSGTTGVFVVAQPSVTFVHTPGAGSKTYTVRAVNISTSTRTLYINRNEDDTNDARRARTASALVIQEVAV